MTKRRIVRSDKFNWAIEEWQEGGDIVTRGKYAGKEKQSRWRAPNQFFGTLDAAARAMFDEQLGDNYTGDQIANLITQSRDSIKDYVKGLVETLDENTMMGILQEKGYVVKPPKGE